MACGVMIVAGVVVAGLMLTVSGPAIRRPPLRPHALLPRLSPSPAEVAFLHVGELGSRGTFQATYAVRGDLVPYGGAQWIVTVAHAGRWPGGGSVGQWSYVLRSSKAGTVQWIERGSRYIDCYRNDGGAIAQRLTSGALSCGAGTNWSSIGFSYLGLPFVPTHFMTDLHTAVENQGWGWSRGSYNAVALFSQTSTAFGRERCLRSTIRRGRFGIGFGSVESISTWCLNAHGLPVNFHSSGRESGTLWNDVRLLAHQSAPSGDLLAPFGRPQASVPLPAM